MGFLVISEHKTIKACVNDSNKGVIEWTCVSEFETEDRAIYESSLISKMDSVQKVLVVPGDVETYLQADNVEGVSGDILTMEEN